jgi:hypothetical protein
MHRAILIEMSDIVREHTEEILEEVEALEELIDEQELRLAQKDEYIEQLTSPRWYIEMAVVCMMSYLYGAWLGVYMCPK